MRLSPRKLPPIPVAEEEEEKGEEIPKEEEEITPFELSLPKDVRCLVYQHLPASTLLGFQGHKLFPEVKECIREVILDTPEVIPAFLAQFPHLKKISGPYPPVKEQKGEHRDFAYVSGITEWAPLIERKIIFDHVAFASLVEDKPVGKRKNALTAEEYYERANKFVREDPQKKERLLQLLAPPLNFAFWTILGLKSGNAQILGGGIFDGGVLGTTLHELARENKITRYWLNYQQLANFSKPTVRTVSLIEYRAKETGLPITEVGVSRHILKDAQKYKPRLTLQKIKKGYKSAVYPLYIDE